jgi:hypothetical protein
MGLRRIDFYALVLLWIGCLIFSSTIARADDDLVMLARKHFNYSSVTSDQYRQAFDKFFISVHQGEVAKFGPDNLAAEEVSKGNSWGPERTVKAEWIMWVCRDPDAVKMVRPSGIQIEGSKIDGEVDLAWLKIEGQLRADGCYLTNGISLRNASVRGLYLRHTYIAGLGKFSPLDAALDGRNLTVQGDVSLFRCEAREPVSFRNSQIIGEFSSMDAKFAYPIDFSFANIGAGADLSGASTTGVANFEYAQISGNLNCSGTTFDPGSGIAFNGSSMKVTGDVLLAYNFRAAVIKYYAVRLFLWLKGYTPLNFIGFLDHCAKLILLKKVVGGYIFIHRMLVE